MDEEPRALLLSIDPLAALGQTQEQLHARLLKLTPVVADELRAASAQAAVEADTSARLSEADYGPEQYLILVTCRDERQQVELLGRFKEEVVSCQALLA